jgi:hypothetical protein
MKNKTEIYTSTYEHKLAYIELYKNIIDSKLDKIKGAGSILFLDKMTKILLELDADIYTVAFNLHTLSNVILQMINLRILNPNLHPKERLDESKISYKTIKKQLEKTRMIYYEDIRNELVNYYDSDKYIYINAFVNTIKHRNIIKTNYYEKHCSATKINHTIIIEAFEYSRNMNIETMKFDEKDYTYIVNDCSKYIIQKMQDVVKMIEIHCCNELN